MYLCSTDEDCVDITISIIKEIDPEVAYILRNIEPSLTLSVKSSLIVEPIGLQKAWTQGLFKKAVVKIVQPEIQTLNGLYLLSTKTWSLLMFVTMMITGPSSNQGHRSFYPTLHRNEVRSSRLNFPMLCLKFCIHCFFLVI